MVQYSVACAMAVQFLYPCISLGVICCNSLKWQIKQEKKVIREVQEEEHNEVFI